MLLYLRKGDLRTFPGTAFLSLGVGEPALAGLGAMAATAAGSASGRGGGARASRRERTLRADANLPALAAGSPGFMRMKLRWLFVRKNNNKKQDSASGRESLDRGGPPGADRRTRDPTGQRTMGAS